MAEKEKKQSVQTIQTKTRVEKGKSGIASVIFGRTGIIILLILLQFGFLIAGYTYLQGKMYFIDSVVKVGAVILVIYLTNNRSNPAFKMVWMTIMLVAPVFGVLLYIFVEFQVGVRWLNARLEHMHETTKKHWTQDEAVQEQLKEEDSEVASLAHYVCEYGGFPAYENTGVKYFSCGEDKIEELIRQLEKAEKFIFMEYFIVAKGYVWDRVLEVLKRKAAEGVEVRFMYDGTCTVSLLPPNYPKKLEQEGIACRVFSPIRPALSTHQNNRDHRKIVVIDGKVAFTGGINLADEYVNRKIRFGHWKDTAIMLEGDAVRSFTLMFLEMWNVAKSEKVEEFDPYLDVIYEREKHSGEGFVIPYGDSPMDCYPVAEKWLAECRLNQYPDGRMANIAPPNARPGYMTPMLCMSAGWGDAAILVPYAMYKRTGDRKILADNYEMMQRWYAFLLGRAQQTTDEQQGGDYAKFTVLNGMDYGEWCEPGITPMQAMMNPRKSVGTAYLAYSGRLLAEVADELGKADDAANYRDTAANAVKAYRAAFTENGVIHSDRQCEYVRAIAFALLGEEESKAAAETLNRMVAENDYHLNTGFLSTPFLCDVLAKYGYADTAYKLLLQPDAPGWLYEVGKGATTVWETWTGIDENGKPHESLNHYSYGAICGWLFGGVCGRKCTCKYFFQSHDNTPLSQF